MHYPFSLSWRIVDSLTRKRENGLSPPVTQPSLGVSVTKRINSGLTPKFSDIKRSMASLSMLPQYLLRLLAKVPLALPFRGIHHHLLEGVNLRGGQGR